MVLCSVKNDDGMEKEEFENTWKEEKIVQIFEDAAHEGSEQERDMRKRIAGDFTFAACRCT